MTTIAWDGKTLATDSRSTANGTILSDKCKKLLTGGAGEYLAVAICGEYSDAIQVATWLLNDQDGDMPKMSDDSAVIAIHKSGELHRYTKSNRVPEVHHSPYADGSGWELALATMDAGLDANRAVKAAIKRDCYTGGKVQSFTIKENKSD